MDQSASTAKTEGCGMNLFGGSSFFGMDCGLRRAGKRRTMRTTAVPDEPEEAGVEAVESGPGELVRRKQQQSEPSWTKRGLFKEGFNTGAPRLRSARKFTK